MHNENLQSPARKQDNHVCLGNVQGLFVMVCRLQEDDEAASSSTASSNAAGAGTAQQSSSGPQVRLHL